MKRFLMPIKFGPYRIRSSYPIVGRGLAPAEKRRGGYQPPAMRKWRDSELPLAPKKSAIFSLSARMLSRHTLRVRRRSSSSVSSIKKALEELLLLHGFLVAISQPQLNGYGQPENKAESGGGKTVFFLVLQSFFILV